ncbi:hypothetical protein HF086_001141 [Spodoptera exigua]|uniref:Zinc finger PHD-type domain-containing protein n=1 Tax=Spodoptera exigua TaxID=7107 RepID=A0A922S8T6_SPOEX|nr:hypothetical protein HF086_001141 [Spodoptera exigua]
MEYLHFSKTISMKRNTRPSSVPFGLLTIALTPSSQLREHFTCGRRVLFCCRAENFKVKTKNKKKTAKRNKQTKKNKDDSEEEDSEELDVIQFDEGSEHDELMDQVPPDSADAECMFCSRLFSMDKSGESWLKCLMCGLWAHYDCAGPEFDRYLDL